MDDNWLKGALDGRKGIFPRSYVKVVCVCVCVCACACACACVCVRACVCGMRALDVFLPIHGQNS